MVLFNMLKVHIYREQDMPLIGTQCLWKLKSSPTFHYNVLIKLAVHTEQRIRCIGLHEGSSAISNNCPTQKEKYFAPSQESTDLIFKFQKAQMDIRVDPSFYVIGQKLNTISIHGLLYHTDIDNQVNKVLLFKLTNAQADVLAEASF